MRVSGESLAPEFEEGDFVLVFKIPFFLWLIRPDDVVVFRHSEYGLLIKRVEWIDKPSDQIFVLGSGRNSVDSRRFGPVSHRDIIGRVIWRIKAKS
jgi:signal peptidase I